MSWIKWREAPITACTLAQQRQTQAGADVTYSVLVDPDVTHTVRGRGKDFVSEMGSTHKRGGGVQWHWSTSDDGGHQATWGGGGRVNSNMHIRFLCMGPVTSCGGGVIACVHAMTLEETSPFIYTHTYFPVVFKHLEHTVVSFCTFKFLQWHHVSGQKYVHPRGANKARLIWSESGFISP